MQLPSALAWSLLLAGADAQLRALRRDSGVCSVEIVATVTRTYTITTSEEVVVPCNTAPGGSGPGPNPTFDGSSSSSIATISSSPESPDSPPSKPSKGDGKEKIDSNLPFDSLIPDDYFPDVTIKEPSVIVTSPSSPSSTSLSPASSAEEDYASPTTITTAIVPGKPSDKDDSASPSPEETDASEPEESNTTTSDSSEPVSTPAESEESQTSDSSEPVSTPGQPSKPEEPEDSDDESEDPVETEDPVSEDPEDSDDSDSEEPAPSRPSEPEDSDVSDPEESDDETSTIIEETPTSTQPADEEPAEATTTEAPSSTEAPEEEPEETTTSAESSTAAADPEPSSYPRNYPADIVDKLQDDSMEKLKEHLKRNASPGCTLENAAVRREWGDLSVAERKEYSAAVQCLQNKPARTPSNIAAGAKSRFDDFVVTHIQQTNTIHNTANFLAWHRYFTWAYETALRDECGYTGYQPYWNWDRYANDPVNSPIFDGSEGSLGGNSNGGGCAATGPFDELKVNLGPGNNLGYNPRCLKRDVQRRFAQQCTADRTMAVLNEGDIGRFQDHMQYSNGIHAGGHFTIGGDPGGDVFTSPGDPVFYLHHAMIDRVWWIWQLQDLNTRLSAVAGRVGGGSNRQGSLQDQVNLGFAGEGLVLKELMDTMGGKGGDFCYIYV